MPLDPELTELTTASPFIATYSFNDIEDGTGVIVYHGFNSEDNSAVDYHASSQPALFSGDVVTISDQGGDTGDDIKVLDLDFDVKFNAPRDLIGLVKAVSYNKHTIV